MTATKDTSTMPSETYFAALNTPDGFKNYFPEILSCADKLYIIKGGPGTGKSRLMREIANEAVNRRFKTELILCSSDVNSLDGVIMTDEKGRTIAFADGTVPHTLEPEIPGAQESIINLGDFWSSEKLAEQKEEIKALNQKKTELYRIVYDYLRAAKTASDVAHSYTVSAINYEKLTAAASRLMRGFKNGEHYSERIRIISSIGMEGANMLDAFENVDVLYSIRDRTGDGYLFLKELLSEAKKNKLSVTVSYSPLELTPDSVIIHGASGGSTAFVLRESIFGEFSENMNVKEINMDRFYLSEALRENRQKYRFARRCRFELIEAALETFKEIKKVHFELEDIYIKAMDFKKKEEFTKKLLINIFK